MKGRESGALARTGPTRIRLGGHSYGGRQASLLAAEDPAVARALLLLAYPLHPPGRPTELIRGETWMPYNPGNNLTPAFPGYFSGHSTFSSASAEVRRRATSSAWFRA